MEQHRITIHTFYRRITRNGNGTVAEIVRSKNTAQNIRIN